MTKLIQYANHTILRRAALLAATLALAMGISQARASSSTVSISFTPTTYTLNPSFIGFSYEKSYLTQNLFRADNTALLACFNQVGTSGVLRIGGTSVDLTGWEGHDGEGPIVQADVNSLAAFVNALPPGWKVIYGLDFLHTDATTIADEASYVQSALGSRLLSFEIGNEPENYGITFNQFVTDWTPYKAAAKQYAPVEGPDSGGNTTWTRTFASTQPGVLESLSEHYYTAAASSYTGNTTGAMTEILTPDSGLPSRVSGDVSAAYTYGETHGFRYDEAGSLSGGGLSGVSDAFGASLWTLDFMFTVAIANGQGVNFHGGSNSPYTPILDNHTDVIGVGPELYGMKLFSLLPAGSPATANISPSTPASFTAYGVKLANGTYAAVLNNKNAGNTVVATVTVGSGVTSMSVLELQCAGGLFSKTGFTIGGSAIHPDGTWTGGVQSTLTPSGGKVTVTVPPATAYLILPN